MFSLAPAEVAPIVAEPVIKAVPFIFKDPVNPYEPDNCFELIQ